MTFHQAHEILELESDSVDLTQVKRAYRRLARRFHPDVKPTGDARKFLQVNAAYELLTHKLQPGQRISVEEEAGFDELEGRIAAVNAAFAQIARDFQGVFDQVTKETFEAAVEHLAAYASADALYQGLESDMNCIVNAGVGRLASHFNSHVGQLAADHDNWIHGFLESTYQEIKERELKNWRRSKHHVRTVLPAAGLGIAGLVGFSLAGYWPLGIVGLGACVTTGHWLYRQSVKKALTLRRETFALDTSPAALALAHHSLQVEVRTSQESMQAGGALLGAAAGFAQGGLGGALIGGLLGSLGGGMFGEPLDELKQRTFEAVRDRYVKILDAVIENLNAEIPKVQLKLISLIRENYQHGKRETIKLLTWNDESGSWLDSAAGDSPLNAVNWAGVIGASAAVLSGLALVAVAMAGK